MIMSSRLAVLLIADMPDSYDQHWNIWWNEYENSYASDSYSIF